MDETNTMITKFNPSKDGILNFVDQMTNKVILIRPDYDIVNNMLNELRESKENLHSEITNYRGQGIALIHADLIKHFIGDIPKSKFNVRVFDHLCSFKQPTLQENYNQIKDESCDGRDIYKAHSYARCNMLGDITLYDIHDTIEKFVPEIDIIECGFYRIQPVFMYQGDKIFLPEAFYISWFVTYLLEKNIISMNNIIEKYVPKAKLKGDILKKQTELIFNTFSEKNAKMISNIGTGMFGKKWKKQLEGFFTTDCDTAKCDTDNGYYPISINDK